jgi:membrane-bound lytic murein transglycosylase D
LPSSPLRGNSTNDSSVIATWAYCTYIFTRKAPYREGLVRATPGGQRVPVKWGMAALVVGFLLVSPARALDEDLTQWPVMEPRVQFWVDVYTSYTTRQAVIHDEENPAVVYGVVELGGQPDGGVTPPPDTDEDIMRLAGERVADILKRPGRLLGDIDDLNRLERDVRAAVVDLPGPDPLAGAADRVRVQRGQADRFRLGLIRSGGYLQTYRRMAREAGVPEDLAFLPHVESAFDTLAHSGAGAAGMWQFMRSTARDHLTINSTRDERLDPWLSAQAAFNYLRSAHTLLGSWPLAITAYNHGPNGMLRAKKRYGDDLPEIIDLYQARTFGFASRNFYAEFLAARRIALDPERWFGPLAMDEAIHFATFTLPHFVDPVALEEDLDLTRQDLRALNPALEATVWRAEGLLPQGYDLRLPPAKADLLASGYESLPSGCCFERVVNTRWYRVRSGDNLGVIARRERTTVATLRRMNGLSGQRFIHPGQRLKVHQDLRFVPVPGGDMERVHVVRNGETLTGIGRRYGIALADLVQANRLADASRLLVGQVLVVPGGE